MRIFHVSKGTPYYRANSLRGIRRAARAGYGAIDLDLQMTKDGRVVGTHWGRPLWRDGFRDPLRKINRSALVSSLTWQQVRRLRVPRGLYRIQPIETLLRECARRGIVAWLEPKADRRFEDPQVWHRIAAIADDCGCELRGYSIRNLGGPNAGVRRVAAMRAAGIRAHVIH